MQLLGGRSDASDNSGSGAAYQSQQKPQPQQQSSNQDVPPDISLPDDSDGDDLPF